MRRVGVVERPSEEASASHADFGALLRAYREGGLLSQERLAERSGLSTRTIRDLEMGRVVRPRLESVRLLADGLRLAGWERERFQEAALGARSAGLARARPVAWAPRGVGPCQLPPDVADFVGRAELVCRLRDLFAPRAAGAAVELGGTAVVVSVVAGKAGVGKSALAVHVAHQLVADFPDGQLYASLGGAGAGGVWPLDPAEILGWFLRAMGVDGAAIPCGVEERAGLYRSRLAGKRVLVVLDDALSQAQVRPLLPGSPSCAVLVTSRARLAGLEGARLVELDVLDPMQAVELLGRIAGPDRVRVEPGAAATIVRACGWLPLAVRVAGARLAAKPHWPLARLAGRLADERRRLDELTLGDLEVRASLSLSYQGLGEEQRRALCLLGLLEAPDVAAWVAAALLDIDLPQAEELLEALVDAQLLEVAGRDHAGQVRYRFHDLLRVYARERAAREEPASGRRVALERALGGWLALAEQADQQLPTSALGIAHGQAARWRPRESVCERLLTDPVAWFEAEWAALVAAVGQSAELGLDELAWDLAGSLTGFLLLRCHFDDWQRALEIALAATRRARNLRGEAHMLHGLGELYGERGHLDDAIAFLDQALLLRRRLGDRRCEAYTLSERGNLVRLHGCFDEAVACYESALVWFRQVGDRRREGMTLRGLGRVHQACGQLAEAAADLEQGLLLFREVGDRLGEAFTLQSLGELHLAQGDGPQARRMLEVCLAVFTEVGDRYGQAVTQQALGRLHRSQGDLEQATAFLTRSLHLFREMGTPLWQARVLSSLAAVHATRGEAVAARAAWWEALELFGTVGAPEAEELAERLRSSFSGMDLQRRAAEQPLLDAAADLVDHAGDLLARGHRQLG